MVLQHHKLSLRSQEALTNALYQESNDDEIFPRDYELKDIGVHDDRENEK